MTVWDVPVRALKSGKLLITCAKCRKQFKAMRREKPCPVCGYHIKEDR